MTFQLDIQDTIFQKIELHEKININDIHNLLKNKIFKDYERSKKGKSTSGASLNNMKKKLIDNTLSVKYSRSIDFGRVYGAKSITYQFLNKRIKNSLCRDNYMDIDIANAHYTILYNLCKNKKIKVPYIKQYVMKRDEIMLEYMKKFNLNKIQVKRIFNSMLYNPNGEDIKTILDNVDYIEKLKNEINMVAIIVSNDNGEMKKKIKKHKKKEKYNELKTLLSFYIQEYENRILEIIYKCLLNSGFIKNGIATLFYDGIMVLYDVNLNEAILETIEKEILKKLAIIVKLIIKPMDDKMINFNVDNNIDIYKPLAYSNEFMESLPSYELKKEYFNRFVSKIRTPRPLYIWNSAKYKEKHILNRKELEEAILCIDSGEFKKNGEEIKFSKLWLEDSSIKIYEKMDFIPYNKDLEPTLKDIDDDIFNLFVGYGDYIHTKYDITKRKKYISLYLDLVLHLVGDKKENFEYYIKFLAQMIQNPRHKPGISVIIKSEQGVGKNFHLMPIRDILRKDHYISSSDPKVFFSDYAEGFYRKILVNMDEVELKSSSKSSSSISVSIIYLFINNAVVGINCLINFLYSSVIGLSLIQLTLLQFILMK